MFTIPAGPCEDARAQSETSVRSELWFGSALAFDFAAASLSLLVARLERATGEIRTPDLLITNQPLNQAKLQWR